MKNCQPLIKICLYQIREPGLYYNRGPHFSYGDMYNQATPNNIWEVDLHQSKGNHGTHTQKKAGQAFVKDGKLGGYDLHLLDDDMETLKKAGQVSAKDGNLGNIGTLPHINTIQDWRVWKRNLLTMKSHMEEYDRILALYLSCMLL